MKRNMKMSVLLILAILAGLFGALKPAEVTAQNSGPRLSVFELVITLPDLTVRLPVRQLTN